MSPEELNEWKKNKQSENIHRITVPVSKKNISDLFKGMQEDSVNKDNIDDTLDAMRAKLGSISTAYKLADRVNNYKTDSLEKKTKELFHNDVRSAKEIFKTSMNDSFGEVAKFTKSLFQPQTKSNWKYIIMGIVITISYVMTIFTNNDTPLLRTIFPNIFLIGSILYSIFKFTDGEKVFFNDSKEFGYHSLFAFCLFLLLFTADYILDFLQYIPINQSGIHVFAGLFLFTITAINLVVLFSAKSLRFSSLMLWIIITLLYGIDMIINASTVHTSHLIWAIVFPSLLVLMGQTHSFAKITVGIFLALFVSELFKNDIENILFA
jgi:hypothetical protein